MIMIVAHHFSVHGGFQIGVNDFSINRFYLQFIQLGGKIGVDIFVLISGYFLINNKQIKVTKVIKLWLEMLFYSVIIYLIFSLFLGQTLSIKGLIKSLIPVSQGHWWFASTYFILYIISPFLNIFLNVLDKKTYKKMLVCTTFMWCIFPTFTNYSLGSNDLILFIYLYSIVGYIKIYKDNIKFKPKKCFLFASIIIILTFISAIMFDIIGTKIPYFYIHATHFYSMEKLPIILISLLLFIGFKNISIKDSIGIFINIISSATFGVYLIHDDYLIRNFLWISLFQNAKIYNSNFLIIYSIFVVIIVYVLCTLIELIRINLIEKKYMIVIDKWYPNVCLKIKKIFNNVVIKNLKYFEKSLQ